MSGQSISNGRGRDRGRGRSRGRGGGRSRGLGSTKGYGRANSKGVYRGSKRGRGSVNHIVSENLKPYAKGVIPMMVKPCNSGSLVISKGSVVEFTGDAIVNAADVKCSGGGGVDKAIHQAAGPIFREATRKIPVVQGARVPTGQARLTVGGNLKAKYVIHAVGPSYKRKGKSVEENHKLLASAYSSALKIANEKDDITSIGFCLLSAGIFRGNQKLQTVLEIGMDEITQNMKPGMEVHLIGYYDVEVRCLMQLAKQT